MWVAKNKKMAKNLYILELKKLSIALISKIKKDNKNTPLPKMFGLVLYSQSFRVAPEQWTLEFDANDDLRP